MIFIEFFFFFQDLSEIGIAVELMHIQPSDGSFDSSLFYQVSTLFPNYSKIH